MRMHVMVRVPMRGCDPISLTRNNLLRDLGFERLSLLASQAEYYSLWSPATTFVTKPAAASNSLGQRLPAREIKVQTDSAHPVILVDDSTGFFKRRHVGHYRRAGDQTFLKGQENCPIDTGRSAEIIGVHDDVSATSSV